MLIASLLGVYEILKIIPEAVRALPPLLCLVDFVITSLLYQNQSADLWGRRRQRTDNER